MSADFEVTETGVSTPLLTSRSLGLARIAKALAAAQRAIKPAVRDSVNPHFKSRYADLASICAACMDALTTNGIAVVQAPSAKGTAVTVETLLIHESGEYLASQLTMTAATASPQAVGSCLTYARRYALSGMVGVAPDDDDGEAAQGRDCPAAPATPVPAEPRADTPPSTQSAGAISERQRKRLYAIYKSNGHSDGDVKRWLLDEYLIQHSADILKADYEAICWRLEKPEPLFAAAVE